jgi:hypothetical protein
MRGRIYRHRVAHGKGASFQLFSSGPPYVHRGVKPQGAVEGRSSRSQSQPGLSVHADRMLASDDPHKRRGCVPRRSLPFGQSGRLYAFRADDRASGHEIASWLGDGREESRRAAIDSRCRIRLDAIICVAAHETTAADDDQSSAGARSAPISLPHLCESSSRAAAIAFHATGRCAGTRPVDRRAAASREAVVSRAWSDARSGQTPARRPGDRRLLLPLAKQASSRDSTAWSGPRPATRGRTRSVD